MLALFPFHYVLVACIADVFSRLLTTGSETLLSGAAKNAPVFRKQLGTISDSAFAPLSVHVRPSEVTGLSLEGNPRPCTESLMEWDVKHFLTFYHISNTETEKQNKLRAWECSRQ